MAHWNRDAFEQVYLPAVQRLYARRFATASPKEEATVFLATDSKLIVRHVMEENKGVVGGLRFAAAGYGADGNRSSQTAPTWQQLSKCLTQPSENYQAKLETASGQLKRDLNTGTQGQS